MKFVFMLIFFLAYSQQEPLPPLNAKIVDYLDQVYGTRVDRGECWDLANKALEYAGAYFDKSSRRTINIYGRRLDPQRDEVLPGDLIQFEKVKMEWKADPFTTYREEMKHHTAIVYAVNAPGDFLIAHQNTAQWGRIVRKSRFVMDRVIKGEIFIYRPVSTKP
jgi:hypothetical protein